MKSMNSRNMISSGSSMSHMYVPCQELKVSVARETAWASA